MSATTGRMLRRTTSLSASPARRSGTATRAISQPASWRRSIWRIVASTSWVSVVHMDWTAIGAPSPIGTPPTHTRLLGRRTRGPTRSSGRLRSTRMEPCIRTSRVAARGRPAVPNRFPRPVAGLARPVALQHDHRDDPRRLLYAVAEAGHERGVVVVHPVALGTLRDRRRLHVELLFADLDRRLPVLHQVVVPGRVLGGTPHRGRDDVPIAVEVIRERGGATLAALGA